MPRSPSWWTSSKIVLLCTTTYSCSEKPEVSVPERASQGAQRPRDASGRDVVVGAWMPVPLISAAARSSDPRRVVRQRLPPVRWCAAVSASAIAADRPRPRVRWRRWARPSIRPATSLGVDMRRSGGSSVTMVMSGCSSPRSPGRASSTALSGAKRDALVRNMAGGTMVAPREAGAWGAPRVRPLGAIEIKRVRPPRIAGQAPVARRSRLGDRSRNPQSITGPWLRERHSMVPARSPTPAPRRMCSRRLGPGQRRGLGHPV